MPRHHRSALPLLAAAFLLGMTTVSFAQWRLPPPPPPPPTAPPSTQPAVPVVEQVTIAEEIFRLELAADDEARREGLSGRDELEPNRGMLFVYPDAQPRTFWMYDCTFDIDLLYLDETGRIVSRHLMKAERPRGSNEGEFAYQNRLKRYRSGRAAQFVVELSPGTIKRLELKPGQLIALDLDRLKKLAR